MKANDTPQQMLAEDSNSATQLMAPLLSAAAAAHGHPPAPCAGVAVGQLLALHPEGQQPIVRCAALHGSAGVVARSTVDLHGAHIGAQVVLAFEGGDPQRPIVTGVLRPAGGWPLADLPAQVQVEADGQRLVVTAQDQLVLRCGKASITLTKAGKVLIEGSYVLSRSTGVNRVKGGSVQLN